MGVGLTRSNRPIREAQEQTLMTQASFNKARITAKRHMHVYSAARNLEVGRLSTIAD